MNRAGLQRRLKSVFAATALLAAAGCQHVGPSAGGPVAPTAPLPPPAAAPTDIPAPPPPDAAAAPLPDKPVLGVFVGVLPCPDCKGIKTELTLFQDRDTYELRETSLGPDGPQKIVVTRGKWTTLRGSELDENDTVYEIGYDRPEGARYFLRSAQHDLTMLDKDQHVIKSKANLTLKRTDSGPDF